MSKNQRFNYLEVREKLKQADKADISPAALAEEIESQYEDLVIFAIDSSERDKKTKRPVYWSFEIARLGFDETEIRHIGSVKVPDSEFKNRLEN